MFYSLRALGVRPENRFALLLAFGRDCAGAVSVIDFREKMERYDSDRDVVLFPARTREGEVHCAISGEALEDHNGAKGISPRARPATDHKQSGPSASRRFLSATLNRRWVRFSSRGSATTSLESDIFPLR